MSVRSLAFGRVGLSLMVGAALLLALAPAQRAPASPVGEQTITITSRGTTLIGLLSPEVGPKSTPLAILIQGSGETDRDGNSPAAGLMADSEKMLAAALNADGVRTFRADKRGQFTNKEAAGTAPVTMTLLANDVRDWAADLVRRAHVPCVWLVGHSAGSLVALLAGQANPNVCGVVSLAGAGRPFGVLVRAQFKSNPGNAPILDDAFRVITVLESGKTVDVSSLHPALRAVFSPASQPIWIDLFSHDPAKLASTLRKPILIIQGDNDRQISLDDARALSTAVDNGAPFILPGMNHVLKIAPTDPTGNLATYRDASLPLAPGLANAVVTFIKAHSRIRR